MTTTYSEFMKTQMAAAGFDWGGRTLRLALTQAAAVGPSTPNDTAGLFAALGWQEVSTVVCPTYAANGTNNPGTAINTQTVSQSPAAPVPVGKLHHCGLRQ